MWRRGRMSSITSTVTTMATTTRRRANARRILSTSVPLRPWKTSVVESHGDYRAEAWLEDHVGGDLYRYQADLPMLPVPTLAHTLERLLPTVLPVCRHDEEVESLRQAVDRFPEQASTLQERLLHRQQQHENANSSWLQHWWNTLGYLQVRESVVINVSYFFHLADDPSATTLTQRGAALLTAAAQYRHQVCSGSLAPTVLGRGDRAQPLCSAAYKYMFHASRIPRPQQDSYKIYDPARYRHAVVARKGHFYTLNLCGPDHATPYPVATLQAGLERIVAHADAMHAHPPPPQLGWLTTAPRDDWAAARQTLLDTDQQYQRSTVADALERLESGAVLLCLDDVHAVSRLEMGQLLLHGAGHNRWFDKSVQLVVTENGKAGLIGEHSMMDGMPMVGLADHCTKVTYEQCLRKSPTGTMVPEPTVEPIFNTPEFTQILQDPIVHNLVDQAKMDCDDWTGRHAMQSQSFQGYGSQFIKQAGFSPDAFVQMAMQLATYRLWGEQAGTYEATQVRPFRHGRTETTRTVSLESAAFVQRLGLRPQYNEHDAEVRGEKLRLLRDAVQAHVRYIGAAAQAQGVDRHFFGLSMLVADGEKAPDLYAHPAFVRAKRWRVSTSHLTHPKIVNWGYGEVVPDGVGLSYSIHPRHCVFNVTALKETGWAEKLCTLLEESLLELRTLIEMDQAPPSSKL
jgi:carnitine O-acetyltransferase